jgi:hypothetical protein
MEFVLSEEPGELIEDIAQDISVEFELQEAKEEGAE